MIKADKPYPPLALAWYALPLAGIIVIALSDAVYLAVSHYRNYADISYQSFCALSKAVNCDTVSQSRYAILFSLPVSVWAVLAYLFYSIIFYLAVVDKSKSRYWGILSLTGMLFSLYSVYLAFISSRVIGSYCIMCIGLYITNLLMAYYPWLIYNRFAKEPFGASLWADMAGLLKNLLFRKLGTAFMILGLGVLVFFPRYWQTPFPQTSQAVSTGVTKKGVPWIGAKTPELTIVEYTDYMCFQCRKMHHYLRTLISRYPDQIRLVHRHFPLDKQFNPAIGTDLHDGSGLLSLIAVFAGTKNRFWETNDFLYTYDTGKGSINLAEIAGACGLDLKSLKTGLTKSRIRRKLHEDILSGISHGVIGTPTYIVNGQAFTGQIPQTVFSRLDRAR